MRFDLKVVCLLRKRRKSVEWITFFSEIAELQLNILAAESRNDDAKTVLRKQECAIQNFTCAQLWVANSANYVIVCSFLVCFFFIRQSSEFRVCWRWSSFDGSCSKCNFKCWKLITESIILVDKKRKTQNIKVLTTSSFILLPIAHQHYEKCKILGWLARKNNFIRSLEIFTIFNIFYLFIQFLKFDKFIWNFNDSVALMMHISCESSTFSVFKNKHHVVARVQSAALRRIENWYVTLQR